MTGTGAPKLNGFGLQMTGEWLFLKSKIFQKKKILLKQCKNGSDWKEDDFSSVNQLCLILYDPMDCNMTNFPVHHQLPKPALIYVHRVSDAIQPSHPLSCPSPPTFSLSQHQGLLQWVSSSHQVAKVLELQLQHQFFQWIFRVDFL